MDRETVRVSTFKKRSFASDCKSNLLILFKVPFNKFMAEAGRHGLKGKVLISVQSY